MLPKTLSAFNRLDQAENYFQFTCTPDETGGYSPQDCDEALKAVLAAVDNVVRVYSDETQTYLPIVKKLTLVWIRKHAMSAEVNPS